MATGDVSRIGRRRPRPSRTAIDERVTDLLGMGTGLAAAPKRHLAQPPGATEPNKPPALTDACATAPRPAAPGDEGSLSGAMAADFTGHSPFAAITRRHNARRREGR